MSLPRINEIIDIIAQFLVQQGHDDRTDDIIENIKNFRLVCRDFAAIGLRYLVPTLVVMRTPEAFDTALNVISHPILRLYVERLVFYYNTFTVRRHQRRHPSIIAIASARLDEFLTTGEDIQKIEYLIRMLPNLNHIEVRALGGNMTMNHRLEPKTVSDRFRSEYNFDSSQRPSLEFLSLVKKMQVLLVHSMLWPLPPSVDTKYLRKLSVTCQWTSDVPTTVFGDMPLLEELQYCGARRYPRHYPEHERIMALPPALRVLGLRNVKFTGESFPAQIHTLELSEVVIEPDALPQELWIVNFTDVGLLNSSLDKWADILLSLKPGCEFKIAGRFSTFSDTPQSPRNISCIHCKTSILETDVGSVLADILQLQSKSDFREELLKRLFEEFCRQGLVALDYVYRHRRAKIEISKSLYSDYLEVKAQHRSTPEVINQEYDCAVCDRCHGHSWSGVVG